jgi:hypothetical protein
MPTGKYPVCSYAAALITHTNPPVPTHNMKRNRKHRLELSKGRRSASPCEKGTNRAAPTHVDPSGKRTKRGAGIGACMLNYVEIFKRIIGLTVGFDSQFSYFPNTRIIDRHAEAAATANGPDGTCCDRRRRYLGTVCCCGGWKLLLPAGHLERSWPRLLCAGQLVVGKTKKSSVGGYGYANWDLRVGPNRTRMSWTPEYKSSKCTGTIKSSDLRPRCWASVWLDCIVPSLKERKEAQDETGPSRRKEVPKPATAANHIIHP